jgi:hypothetical protein
MPKNRELIIDKTGTIIGWWKPYQTSGTQVLCEAQYDSNNLIKLHHASNAFVLTYKAGGVSVTASTAATVTAGTNYFLAARWDKNKGDGTNYLKVNWNYSTGTGVSTTKLGYMEDVKSTIQYGADNSQANQADGNLYLRIYDFWIPSATSDATTAGLSGDYCLAGLYASGSGLDKENLGIDEHVLFELINE